MLEIVLLCYHKIDASGSQNGITLPRETDSALPQNHITILLMRQTVICTGNRTSLCNQEIRLDEPSVFNYTKSNHVAEFAKIRF